MTAATEVKERPILFSRPMVRAILEGRKTMTRRVIKPQPDSVRNSPFVPSGLENEHGYEIKCPYGKPGDHLWVRETWRSYDLDGTVEGAKQTLRYLADGNEALITWKPSIFMPRWASRITLEITGIRVERVQQISGQDAKAEGVIPVHDYEREVNEWITPFKELWDSINGKRPGCGWQSNPFVWVIGFKRVSQAEGTGGQRLEVGLSNKS